jgi:hypothetical protein
MAGRTTLLSPEVLAAVVATIEAGAFDWVAAEAAGIGRRTFYDWLRRGEAGEEPYAEFLVAVRRARASARGEAERTVRLKNPLAWLRLGPGRERPGEPGWTSSNKPPAEPTDGPSERTVREVLEEVERP